MGITEVVVRASYALTIALVIAFSDAATAESASPASASLRADIPPQPLAAALEAFADQTGLELVYVSSILSDRKTPGAHAGLSALDALTRLLEGTGLRFEFLNSRSVRILVDEAAAQPTRQRIVALVVPEEVLVTATKREESMTTVPMSISVLSSEALIAFDIKDIEGVAARMTGLEYDFSSQFGSGTLTNLAIRGIRSETGQSTTALYLDETPIHAWHIDTAFGNPYPVVFDMARVEVLRGPQGTLFGTGAEGGAIRFITNPPSTTRSDALSHAEISVTEHGEPSFEAGVAVGGPLVEGNVGARISAWYQSEGGFVDRVDPFNLATVEENANRDTTRSLRVAFALTPGDAVRITPAYAYQALDIHDSPSFYTYLSNPGAGILRNGKLLRQPATDTFSLWSLKVEADIGAATLTSASAYFERNSVAAVDRTNEAGTDFFGGFGNPLGPAYPTSYLDAVAGVLGSHQFITSQEIRLASRDSAAALTWLVGAFYGHARTNQSDYTYAVTDPLNPGLFGVEDIVDTDRAIFGNAALNISARWRIGLGARFDQTKADSTVLETGFANPVTVPLHRSVDDTGNSLAPRFVVSYEPQAGGLLYAGASKGFRAGGLNVPECGAPPKYAPDFVWSYELGAKDSVFENRLQLGGSIFYAKWTDIQQHTSTKSNCFVDYTSNLGEAVSRGFDLTADALLGDRTYVGIAVGYLDAHYTNTIKSGGKVIVEEGTAVGELPAVPSPWSLIANAEYRLPLSSSVTSYARAEEIVRSHNPGPFLEANPESPSFNPAVFAAPATKLLNLYLGVRHAGLDLRISVLNVLNSQPLLQHDSDAPYSTLQYAFTFRPRTLALTATQRF